MKDLEEKGLDQRCFSLRGRKENATFSTSQKLWFLRTYCERRRFASTEGRDHLCALVAHQGATESKISCTRNAKRVFLCAKGVICLRAEEKIFSQRYFGEYATLDAYEVPRTLSQKNIAETLVAIEQRKILITEGDFLLVGNSILAGFFGVYAQTFEKYTPGIAIISAVFGGIVGAIPALGYMFAQQSRRQQELEQVIQDFQRVHEPFP